MDRMFPLGHEEDLIIQIETDFENLKESIERYKMNSADKKLRNEIWENYAFLVKDLEYFEKQDRSNINYRFSSRLVSFLNNVKNLLIEVEKTLRLPKTR